MTEKRPVGRPIKEIDWNMFEELCALHCTQREIASFFGMNRDTLREKALLHYNETHYESLYERFLDAGKISLRRKQLKLAGRNAAVAIFLGKNYLGQKDNDTTITIAPELTEQFTAIMKQLAEGQRVIAAETVKNEAIDDQSTHSL